MVGRDGVVIEGGELDGYVIPMNLIRLVHALNPRPADASNSARKKYEVPQDMARIRAKFKDRVQPEFTEEELAEIAEVGLSSDLYPIYYGRAFVTYIAQQMFNASVVDESQKRWACELFRVLGSKRFMSIWCTVGGEAAEAEDNQQIAEVKSAFGTPSCVQQWEKEGVDGMAVTLNKLGVWNEAKKLLGAYEEAKLNTVLALLKDKLSYKEFKKVLIDVRNLGLFNKDVGHVVIRGVIWNLTNVKQSEKIKLVDRMLWLLCKNESFIINEYDDLFHEIFMIKEFDSVTTSLYPSLTYKDLRRCVRDATSNLNKDFAYFINVIKVLCWTGTYSPKDFFVKMAGNYARGLYKTTSLRHLKQAHKVLLVGGLDVDESLSDAKDWFVRSVLRLNKVKSCTDIFLTLSGVALLYVGYKFSSWSMLSACSLGYGYGALLGAAYVSGCGCTKLKDTLGGRSYKAQMDYVRYIEGHDTQHVSVASVMEGKGIDPRYMQYMRLQVGAVLYAHDEIINRDSVATAKVVYESVLKKCLHRAVAGARVVVSMYYIGNEILRDNATFSDLFSSSAILICLGSFGGMFCWELANNIGPLRCYQQSNNTIAKVL